MKKLNFPFLLFAGGCLVYLRVLLAPNPVNPDGHLLLPFLDKLQGLDDYLHKLFAYEAWDFQPIRDLTLYFDLVLQKAFDINTLVWQNFIYWILACIGIRKILTLEKPSISDGNINFIVFLFASYPLFVATVSWGVARKHILSFMFIVYATYFHRKQFTNKMAKLDWIYSSCFYVLSIFSQPIAILWPIWACIARWVESRKISFSKVRSLVPSCIWMVIGIYLNIQYYEKSELFKTYFEPKTTAYSISDRILALGHYVYQLFFPYQSAYSYQLGHWSVLVGLALLVLGATMVYKARAPKLQIIVWSGFLFFPLVVVLVNPHILSDNYLLTPALGLLMVLVVSLRQFEFPKFLPYVLLLFWGGYSFRETNFWIDRIRYSEERNFGRRPNCDSALNLIRVYGALQERTHEAAKTLAIENNCFNPKFFTKSQVLSYFFAKAYLIYYDPELTLNQKIEYLEPLSRINYNFELIQTALKGQRSEEEIYPSIEALTQNYQLIQWEDRYEPIIAKVLHPLCEELRYQNCLRITQHFLADP